MIKCVTAAALAASVLAVLPVAPASAARYCGLVRDRDGARVAVRIERRGTTCARARRVLGAYMRSTAPCASNACPRVHLGWRCSSATTGALPRLASCARRRTLIAAHSTTD